MLIKRLKSGLVIHSYKLLLKLQRQFVLECIVMGPACQEQVQESLSARPSLQDLNRFCWIVVGINYLLAILVKG